MFAKFETLHPSKLAAFVDGALCAAAITYTTMKLRQGYLAEKREIEEFEALTREMHARRN